jgi:hypothetical protein
VRTVPRLAADALAWLDGPKSAAAQLSSGFALGRRWLMACFVVFAGYACAMAFAGGNEGTWAEWAVGGYAVAAVAAWRWRRRAVPLLVALAFGIVAPTVWLVLRAPATPDVVVVTQSARQLLHHGSPYLPAGQLTTVTSYNPYLPGMAIFGLPGAAGLPGLLGDTRPWLVAVTLVLLAASFWIAGPHRLAHRDSRPEPRPGACRSGAVWSAVFAVGSPVLALSLAVGITDGPIIALVCLALACVSVGGSARVGQAAARPLTRPVAPSPRLLAVAGLAVGVACAMKFTAWPALPVIAAMLWSRDGGRIAARFTAVSAVTAVALVAAFAPALLMQPGALVQNVVLFPLGLTQHKTPAASPVPGHILADFGPAGHAAAIGLLIAAAVAVAASLVLRPPADVRAAVIRLAAGLVLLFALAPASRFGYFAYPIALLGWLAMTGRGRAAAGPAPAGSAAAVSLDGRRPATGAGGSTEGLRVPTGTPSPPGGGGSAATGPGRPA